MKTNKTTDYKKIFVGLFIVLILALSMVGQAMATTTISDTLVDSVASTFTVADGGNLVGLSVTQNDITNNNNGIDVVNAGTGNGQFIDQNGQATGLYIDSESIDLSKPAILIDSIGRGMSILPTGTSGNVLGLEVDNQYSTTPTGDLVLLRNDGTGNGQFIDQNGNGVALNIDSEATTADNFALKVYSGQGATTARFQTNGNGRTDLARNNDDIYGRNWFYGNSNSVVTSAPLVLIEQDNAGDDQNALSIQNDGTGRALNVVQAGDGEAIKIDNGGTSTSNLVTFQNDGTGNGLFIDQNGNGRGLFIDSEATTIDALNIQGNQTTTDVVLIAGIGIQTNPLRGVLRVTTEHASSSGSTINIKNAGTGNGLLIDQNGNGIGLNIDNAGTKPSMLIVQTQDVEVIDFDNVIDGGTTHTTLAGSIKIEMPNGATGYINLYT